MGFGFGFGFWALGLGLGLGLGLRLRAGARVMVCGWIVAGVEEGWGGHQADLEGRSTNLLALDRHPAQIAPRLLMAPGELVPERVRMRVRVRVRVRVRMRVRVRVRGER